MFNLLILFLVTLLVKPRAALLVFRDPLLGEASILNLFQELLHRLAGLVGNDAWTRSVVSVLCGVAYGIAHVAETAAIHQVNDELELVHAFEIGELGLVPGFDEG